MHLGTGTCTTLPSIPELFPWANFLVPNLLTLYPPFGPTFGLSICRPGMMNRRVRCRYVDRAGLMNRRVVDMSTGRD